ncbi:MAG: hypothetical protein CNIPEHKO_03450 [Anaerolineales bacterium]|nr:hypothetical protein [Anaerolineales bacterium]
MSTFNQKNQKVKEQYNVVVQLSESLLSVANLDEKALSNIRNLFKVESNKKVDLSQTHDLVNSLVAFLEQEIGKQQTDLYLESIARVNELVLPVISESLNLYHDVLPYASIVDNLLSQMAEYFEQTDCFSIYGHLESYEESYQVSLPDPSSDLLTYNKNKYPIFVSPPPKRHVLPLENVSNLLKTDLFFKTKIGFDILFERRVKEYSKPTEHFFNKLLTALSFEPLFKTHEEKSVGVLYCRIPGSLRRIYLFDKYFIRLDYESQSKISVQTYTNLFYGLILDLLNYIYKLKLEADLGQKTLNSANKVLGESQ